MKHTPQTKSIYHKETYPKAFLKLWNRQRITLIKKHYAYDWWKKGYRAGLRRRTQ
jgi:hypothetical protein